MLNACASLMLALDDPRMADRARRWSAIVREFASNSPLTQLVYGDLFWTEATWPEIRAIPAPTLAANIRPLVALAPEQLSWRELWLSHLARSLVGVVTSPSPAHERHRRKQAQCAAREREGRQAAGGRRYDPSRDAELQQLIRERNALAEAGRYQRLARLARLNAIWLPQEAVEAPTYVQLRFLDMLVRHLATRSMDQLHEQWAQMAGQGSAGRVESERLGDVLLSETSGLRAAFEETLLGQPVQVWGQSLAQAAGGREWLAGQLEMLLDPPLDPPANVERSAAWTAAAHRLAPVAGVPDRAARELVHGFCEDGIEVTFQPRHPQTFPPARLLRDWMLPMLSALR